MNKTILNKIPKAFTQSFETQKPTKVEWGLCIGIFVFLFFCFQYVDFESLTIWSVNFWEVIFNGRGLQNFFAFTAENRHNLYHPYMGADIFYIIPWALWNFPIALIYYFAGVDILTNSMMMAWSRLFLVAALAVTLLYAYKITMIMTNDHIKSWWVVFLTASSMFVYSGIFYAGQGDIVMVCFMTIGIYFLMKDNIRLFVIYFAIAIALKPFAIIAFIPTLLIREKNVLKYAAALLGALSITLISRGISYLMPGFAESMQYSSYNIETGGILNNILLIRYIFGIIPISLFVIAYAVLCILCYFIIKPKENKQRNEYIIYTAATAYLLFFVFTAYEVYRIIYLIPFIHIMIIYKTRELSHNIILEMFLQMSCFFASYVRDTWYYNPQLLRNSIYLKIFGLPHNLPSRPIFERLTYENYYLFSMFTVIFTATALIIIAINYPGINLDIKERKCIRPLIWLRMAIFLPFVGHTFTGYVSTYLQ